MPPSKRRVRLANTKHTSGLTVRKADIARARPFEWAWDQRVLMGYLNLQVGEEGIGKGNLTAWIAARISRGELPGDLHGRSRKVAFIGDEDAWDHIWVPRLKAAGADLKQLDYIVSGPNGEIDVKEDADSIRRYVKSEGTALVYFDQLLDNLGIADSWKDKEVRNALAPLRRVAAETKCALLASMHPNKRKGSFRDQISGTPAFNALSRSSLLVASHPEEPGRAVVVRGKGNYSPEPPAFEFRIEEETLVVKGRAITTSRITAMRETSLRRDDLLKASKLRPESKAGQARGRLAELFANGEVRPAADVLQRMKAEGFTERAVQTARVALELKTWQEGYQGPWMWAHVRPKVRVKRKRSQ